MPGLMSIVRPRCKGSLRHDQSSAATVRRGANRLRRALVFAGRRTRSPETDLVLRGLHGAAGPIQAVARDGDCCHHSRCRSVVSRPAARAESIKVAIGEGRCARSTLSPVLEAAGSTSPVPSFVPARLALHDLPMNVPSWECSIKTSAGRRDCISQGNRGQTPIGMLPVRQSSESTRIGDRAHFLGCALIMRSPVLTLGRGLTMHARTLGIEIPEIVPQATRMAPRSRPTSTTVRGPSAVQRQVLSFSRKTQSHCDWFRVRAGAWGRGDPLSRLLGDPASGSLGRTLEKVLGG